MFEKVQSVLRVYGMILPAAVRGVILDFAAKFESTDSRVARIESDLQQIRAYLAYKGITHNDISGTSTKQSG